MPYGEMYCHAVDVMLASHGDFDALDEDGRLVSRGVMRREIVNQSGVILAGLRDQFGDNFHSFDFWVTYPFPHPRNESSIELERIIIPESFGFDEITIEFISSTDFTVRTEAKGLLGTGTITTGFSQGGLIINKDDFTGTPEENSFIYSCCYNIDPMIVNLCSKLTALEIVDNLLRAKTIEINPRLVREGHKRYLGMLDDLASGKKSLDGRKFIDVGQFLSKPLWEIDDLGQDQSDYNRVIE